MSLTPRQSEALDLIAEGLTQREAACRMGISVNTVRALVKGAYRALDAHNAVEAAVKSGRLSPAGKG